MRVWRCGRVVGAVLNQPEDANDPFSALERHRAELHGHPSAVAVFSDVDIPSGADDRLAVAAVVYVRR